MSLPQRYRQWQGTIMVVVATWGCSPSPKYGHEGLYGRSTIAALPSLCGSIHGLAD